MAKAFDKVWHAGLEFKILLPGLPDISTKSICTFIDNRITYINIKHYNGPSFQIRSEVPQGSPLSPTLYTIYTADIPAPTHRSLNIMYADTLCSHLEVSKNDGQKNRQRNNKHKPTLNKNGRSKLTKENLK